MAYPSAPVDATGTYPGTTTLLNYLNNEIVSAVNLHMADAVQHSPPSSLVEVNNITVTPYTLVLSDGGKVLEMNVNLGGSITEQVVTVPANASVAFPIGTVLELWHQGTAPARIAAAAGVTIRTAATLSTRAQYATLGLRKRGTDTWVLSGDLA